MSNFHQNDEMIDEDKLVFTKVIFEDLIEETLETHIVVHVYICLIPPKC